MAITSNKRRLSREARIAGWPDDLKPLGLTKVTKVDFTWLQQHVLGEVVLPGDPDYAAAIQQNPLYPAKPQAVVFCETFEDVGACVQFSTKNGLWVAARSGRHSTAGFSTNDGLVIDTSRMMYVVVDPDRRQAIVGAGTQFATLNARLNSYGLHVPGGTCDDVCVAGFMMGGGYGLTSREFGVGCDSIIGAQVMLANGKVVVCNAHKNEDLFWAIRGGTGGNFGVLLELTFELQRLRDLYGFALSWPIAQAPDALTAMQTHFMSSPDSDSKVGYLSIVATLKGQRVAAMIGTYDGSEADAKGALEKVTSVGKPTWMKSETGTYAYLNDALFDVLPGPGDAGTLELKEAHYIRKPVARPQWDTLCAAFDKTPNDYNLAVIEPYGGRINARPKLWNAFVHREVAMDFFVDSFFNPAWPKCKDQKTAQAFLDSTMAAMNPAFDDFVYQNYPRRDSPDYRWAYWGDAFPTLLFVKQKYNPGNVFHYEQSISRYPDDPKIHRSTATSIFHDPRIDYAP